jgi:hypothetical protein
MLIIALFDWLAFWPKATPIERHAIVSANITLFIFIFGSSYRFHGKYFPNSD